MSWSVGFRGEERPVWLLVLRDAGASEAVALPARGGKYPVAVVGDTKLGTTVALGGPFFSMVCHKSLLDFWLQLVS